MKARTVDPIEIFEDSNLNLSAEHYIKADKEPTKQILYEAIQERCLDCLRTDDVNEVVACQVTTCPLYPYRCKNSQNSGQNFTE